MHIVYIDRRSRKLEQEKIYGYFFIDLLYGNGWKTRFFGRILRLLVAHFRWLSLVYGWFQSTSFSRYKIAPFVRRFGINAQEFVKPLRDFDSFNDFFSRRLKPESRPFAQGTDIAIAPTDGRYLVFENLSKCDGFVVKGIKFHLEEFLGNQDLAQRYAEGTLVLIRLCPIDYHRFHFPFSCTPQASIEIPGALYSVNLLALKQDISFLAKNKRVLSVLLSKHFGQVLFVEVGATYVGSIHQVFTPQEPYTKGEEKGYFSFGGSCIAMFFEQGQIQIDRDLLEASAKKIEMRCRLGESLGRSLNPF